MGSYFSIITIKTIIIVLCYLFDFLILRCSLRKKLEEQISIYFIVFMQKKISDRESMDINVGPHEITWKNIYKRDIKLFLSFRSFYATHKLTSVSLNKVFFMKKSIKILLCSNKKFFTLFVCALKQIES